MFVNLHPLTPDGTPSIHMTMLNLNQVQMISNGQRESTKCKILITTSFNTYVSNEDFYRVVLPAINKMGE